MFKDDGLHAGPTDEPTAPAGEGERETVPGSVDFIETITAANFGKHEDLKIALSANQTRLRAGMGTTTHLGWSSPSLEISTIKRRRWTKRISV
jgi:hypothetical protein